jgi:dTDP-glucose 4,6-dehydratase/UDP-glucose 4-epimerase
MAKGHEIWQANTHYANKLNYFVVTKENSNFETIFATQQFDICINASGSAHVGFSFENPAIDYELNTLNVQKILVALHKYNPTCKLINFSSAAVYGNPQKLPISENTATQPMSPYGFHKLQSEYLLTEYHKFFGLKTCSLRVFSAYGERLQKQLFWDLYQKAKNSLNTKIDIFGTGKETRDFIYIADLVKCVDLIIENAKFEGETINVASGLETTISEVVTTFYTLLNPKIEFNFSGKTKVGDPNNWRAEISIIQKMGFIPTYTIVEGLTNYVTWLKTEKE